MSKMDSTRLEELLDWLAEEVAARLRAQAPAPAEPQSTPSAPAAPPDAPAWDEAPVRPGPDVPGSVAVVAEGEDASLDQRVETQAREIPIPAAPGHAARLLSRLALGLLAAVVLVNIPLGLRGRALARLVPSRAVLVIRDGLLVREEDKPDVHVYKDGAFHWITDLEVFEHYGYRWQDVRAVEAGFLAGYESGRPLYLLAKCPGSPHIYRLENGVKRWIVDIAAFEAAGHVWEDVRTMDCYTLRNMPMGETIPAGQGPAPEP